MSRFAVTLALLAGSAMVAACADHGAEEPTVMADRTVAFNRVGESTSRQRTVRATGDPSSDVRAVQMAVDQGGSVVLRGHFSFDMAPSTDNAVAADLPPAGLPKYAEVKITKAVTISGGDEDDDDMAVIDGGTIPFYVEAPGQTVTIRRLRFVRPISHAIVVFAVGSLEISSTKLDSLTTFSSTLNGAVGIYTLGAIPNATKPGKPSNVSGRLLIADNDFDVGGGTATENVLGITVFSVGDSTAPVDARISRNTIRNITEPAINFRRVVGRVLIDHNVIRTGTVGVANARSQAIRVANLGTYVITHNVIDCEWAGVGDAEAIGVFSQISAWPIEHATIEYNRVAMSQPKGTTFTDFSAGIGLFGFANANVVRHNVIRGTARAGISMPVFPLTPPVAQLHGNALLRNNFEHFTPTVADIFIGQNAPNTQVLGRGTVIDESKVP